MMTIADVEGYLNALTYSAQFDHPLKKGIDRVMRNLVMAHLPQVKTAQRLSGILQLLNSSEYLSSVSSPVEGRSEDEIRDFLQSLSVRIQEDYPRAVCSGRFAPTSGAWRCYEHPEVERVVKGGETLPTLNSTAVVWEIIPVKGSLSSIDALKSEFVSYYTRACLAHAVEYQRPEPYSQASAERLTQVLSENQTSEAKGLLREVFLDKSNPITVDVIKAIKFDWFETPETTAWYQEFIRGIISKL